MKVWLYLSRKAQRKRLLRLEKDRRTRWRVSPDDWKHNAAHERLDALSRKLMTATDQPGARWTIVDGEDSKERDLAVGEALLKQLTQHLLNRERKPAPAQAAQTAPQKPLVESGRLLLEDVDLSSQLAAGVYRKRMHDDLANLNRLAWDAEKAKRSIVFVFEGWDAA